MPQAIPAGLVILHGNRAERLAETVAAWLARQPLAPLEEEVMLVQSNGMAEWLKMTLASQQGICAATRVELPGRFQWRLYRQLLGREQVPADSPFDKTPLTWRLMQRLPTLLAEPGFEPVAAFMLGDEPERLLQLARRLADLLDQYQVYRADWLEAWAQGNDVLPSPGRPDQPLPPEQRWQPALWRTLLASLDERQRAALRPQLHRQALAALRSPGRRGLPRRVVLFGMTHMPLPLLELLAAMGQHAQVLMAIPNPCRFHWADIMDGRELLRQQVGAQRRRQPLRQGRDLAELPLDAMHAHAHPLLAAWGRQGRDFVRQLDAFDSAALRASSAAPAAAGPAALWELPAELPRIDLFDDEEDRPEDCLLAQVQARIRDLVPLAEHAALARPVPAADRSIVFHITHGAMREVEVLHDQLLHLLAHPPAGQPLAPRDIVVMVPDVAAFEPAIRAVFGQWPRHDPRYIPFDIADLGARQSSPLVLALEWLLRLPQQRCTFSELRGLLDVPALARRFGIAAGSLPQLTAWMVGAGLRWGLDLNQRDALGLAACGEQNSGAWAVNRMLLGYANGTGPLATHSSEAEAEQAPGCSSSPALGQIEPYGEVAGLEAELAGALAQCLARLRHWWQVLREPASPQLWAERGRALLADFFSAADDAERATLAALDEALVVWLDACEQAGMLAEPQPLAVAREAWLEALDQPSLNRRFRAGGVTFCTLMPMRAIPFEVVCLLGMNDGDYPRRAPRSDFDLMGLPGQTRPGDRARRDDDRQLMLEALLSARRVLYLSWAGRHVRDNTEQPPSVLVSQLRDYLAAGWSPELLAERTTEHPLQPFSRRYFEAVPPSAMPTQPGLFTYAREWRRAHDAAALGASASPALGTVPAFVPDPCAPLSLERLAAFLRNPVKAFFRHRLQVNFDGEPDGEGSDDESFAIAGLEEHSLVDGLLRAALEDAEVLGAVEFSAPGAAAPFQTEAVDIASLVTARVRQLRRAGQLPIGAMGDLTEAQLGQSLSTVLQAWQALLAEHPEPAPHQPVSFSHEGVLLQDWLDGLRQAQPLPLLAQWQAGRLLADPAKGLPRVEKLILPWLRCLASAAVGTPVAVVIVGREASVFCQPPSELEAQQTLAALLSAWRQGQDAPLPVAPRTALAWLQAREEGRGEPASVYEGGFRIPAEVAEPCLARLYPDFAQLCADGGFAHWAEQLYQPLRAWAASSSVSVSLHQEWAQEEGAV